MKMLWKCKENFKEWEKLHSDYLCRRKTKIKLRKYFYNIWHSVAHTHSFNVPYKPWTFLNDLWLKANMR